jgi:hypothetical protein
MLRPVAILIAALFSTVTTVAYAADQDTQGEQKEAMKKKYESPTVEQGAPAAEGRGDPTGAAAGGAVQQGAPAAEGRGDPTGAPAAGGGAVTSPTPTGPGRGDNQ